MKIKNILLRLAAAIAAFVFGIGIFSGAQYAQSVFQANERETESGARAGIDAPAAENLIYPRPLAGETKVFGAERPITNFEPEIKSEPVEEEKTAGALDRSGYYYIIGDLPSGFKDFEWFDLTTRDYKNAAAENNYEGIPITPEGSFLTNKPFNFVKISLSDKWIAFETEAIDGISYKFVGEFPDEPEKITVEYDDGSGAYTDEAILKGRLVKMRNGKKIIEREVKFGYTIGC
jgi:hypothetical protein